MIRSAVSDARPMIEIIGLIPTGEGNTLRIADEEALNSVDRAPVVHDAAARVRS